MLRASIPGDHTGRLSNRRFHHKPAVSVIYYLPVILGFAHKYDEKVGLGTVIANMLPFSVTFAIAWILQVVIWVLLNLPLGPGGAIYL